MAPVITERASEQKPQKINEQIRQETERNIAIYSSAGRAIIDKRLTELNEEWDVERALETNASMAAILGLFLGVAVNRRWLILPSLVAGFLLQHALGGWSLPVGVLRRLGFRTRAEIERERYAMKILRGDFQKMPKQNEDHLTSVREILEAEER